MAFSLSSCSRAVSCFGSVELIFGVFFSASSAGGWLFSGSEGILSSFSRFLFLPLSDEVDLCLLCSRLLFLLLSLSRLLSRLRWRWLRDSRWRSLLRDLERLLLLLALSLLRLRLRLLLLLLRDFLSLRR